MQHSWQFSSGCKDLARQGQGVCVCVTMELFSQPILPLPLFYSFYKKRANFFISIQSTKKYVLRIKRGLGISKIIVADVTQVFVYPLDRIFSCLGWVSVTPKFPSHMMVGLTNYDMARRIRSHISALSAYGIIHFHSCVRHSPIVSNNSYCTLVGLIFLLRQTVLWTVRKNIDIVKYNRNQCLRAFVCVEQVKQVCGTGVQDETRAGSITKWSSSVEKACSNQVRQVYYTKQARQVCGEKTDRCVKQMLGCVKRGLT